MEELGKEMVEHCGGLLLGVLVLGGILATKHNLKDWKIVHKGIRSYLEKGTNIEKDQGGLHNILALSFNDLPYQLKPCFLYLSKYLEDVDIETESLYQIWMAEGMISTDDQIGEDTMMDVAERYLEELAERCMVVVEMEEVPSIRRFKSCRLHDLMREMCLHKAKEENFLELIDDSISEFVESSSISSRSTPRFSIHMGRRDVTRYVTPRKEVSQRLRSFSFSIDGEYDGQIKFQCDEFRMLRVLSIEGLVLDISDETSCGETCLLLLDNISFPRAIGKLIHLRYLSLRDSSFLSIPSSISKLKCLQTLDLCCYFLIRVPNTIRKLERLKHLYLPDGQVLCKLSLNGLHNLEILEKFHSGNSDIKVLSTLTKLRHLTTTVQNKLEHLEEFINQVNNLIYLRFLSLKIVGCDFCSDEGSTLLRKVFSWSRLNILCITWGRISKFPEYEPCFLPNLHELSFGRCEIKEDPMRTLEKLPNLRNLYLWQNSFMGEKMICHATSFPQLKSLKLCLNNLYNWLIEEGDMPNLSHLEIRECRELKTIPDGLRFVTTLKELRIINMPKEFNSRLQVKDGQEGEDFDKVHHVPSIIVCG